MNLFQFIGKYGNEIWRSNTLGKYGMKGNHLEDR